MERFNFIAGDDAEIACYLWEDVENPKAIIQLSHGMGEHIRRYDDFARYLNKHGFIVFGDDHRGHGRTSGIDNLGSTSKTVFYDTVDDIIELGTEIKEKYKLPIILLGHSYGSFLSQAVIEETDIYSLCVLVGTASQDSLDMKFAKILTALQNIFVGGKKPAKLLTKLGFEGYNKPFKDEKMLNSWLTTNKEIVRRYNDDPECGFMFDINFYYSLSRAFSNIYKKQNLEKINKKLPILITSGKEDPVGKMGKSTTRLYEKYKNLNIENLEIKLYENKRHEILNSLEKEKVYDDIINFINKYI